MSTLLYSFKLIPVILLILLLSLVALLQQSWAGWLQYRLNRQYDLYTCGRSLAVQIRPDLGRLYRRCERARDRAGQTWACAQRVWRRLRNGFSPPFGESYGTRVSDFR